MFKISSLFLRSIGAVFLFTLAMISIPGSSFALSSATQQFSSNLFVEIAKKAEPCCGKRECKIKNEKSA
jgi:hypothetical protein